MTLTFNPLAYRKLLDEFMPKIIETEGEYEQMLERVEKLTFCKNRTLEEQALYQLLVQIVEVYENKNYQLDKSMPHEILQHIMDSSGICQADLVGIIGSSGVVSEIVSGKRSISKAQAKALGSYFKVTPSLFI